MSFFSIVLTLLFLAEMVMGSCDDKTCNCLSRNEIPAFSALLTRPKNPGTRGSVKFDKVVTNILNGYNPTTGTFTAPVAGVYQFSYTVLSSSTKYLIVYLDLNNTRQQSLTAHGIYHDTGTTSIILNLKKGDQVAIKSYGNYIIHSDGNMYSSFSGYRIV